MLRDVEQDITNLLNDQSIQNEEEQKSDVIQIGINNDDPEI